MNTSDRPELTNLARQLHDWYLEATEIHGKEEDYNEKALVPYDDLPIAQKFIDLYIASKLLAIHNKLQERIDVLVKSKTSTSRMPAWWMDEAIKDG